MLEGFLSWLRSVGFSIGEAFVNLRRHRLMTAAAITTIAVTLILVGSFLLTFYQVKTATDRAASEFEMRVFCRDTVTKAQVPEIRQRIRQIPGVATVEYTSREQAFRDYTHDLPIDVRGIPNKFSEEFKVTFADPKKAGAVARVIRGWHGDVQEVALPEKEMSGVLRIIAFLRTIGFVTATVLLFGALVVVSNTIRLSVFSRRREIRIMQIVGAAPWFIRLPMLLEGLIHGLLGGLVASACLYAVDRSAQRLITDVIPMLARYFTRVDMLQFAVAITGAGALIGMLGSLLSIRRYLRAI
ncbi:MAG: permease-like cell division protein FtsX [Capsulimonadales bacterium]|nr:permease-like cell division protein FtsX [Capsulimonadales bacterium]